jgi:NADH-quinone oxidoreductase subunit D
MTTEPQFDRVDMMLNMGPQHPATHGVFRMVLTVDGERVVDVTPHIGYLHRGTERLAEVETYGQVITLFDRVDYISNLNNELAFVRAGEKIMEVEAPERAQYIRVILAELNRVASHLLFIGTYAIDLGGMTPVMYCFRERERIENLFEHVTGARMMHNYMRIGGVKSDVPDDFVPWVRQLIGEVRKGVEESDKLLSTNEVFLGRTRGVGVIDNYKVPVGENGDCWDRYYLRVLECYESLNMIEQCLGQFPAGPIMAAGRRIARPPAGEVFAHSENPRGDLGVYLVSDGSDKPYRVKIRPPSFCNLVGLATMTRGSYIADAVAILGSLDIVLGEVDR